MAHLNLSASRAIHRSVRNEFVARSRPGGYNKPMAEPRWDSLLSGDPAQVERGIDDWVAGVRQRADRMQQLKVQVDRIQVTETSKDGAVTVTVDANGVPTD